MLAYDLFNEGVIIHADEAYLNKVKSKFNQTVEREHVTEKGNFLFRGRREEDGDAARSSQRLDVSATTSINVPRATGLPFK